MWFLHYYAQIEEPTEELLPSLLRRHFVSVPGIALCNPPSHQTPSLDAVITRKNWQIEDTWLEEIRASSKVGVQPTKEWPQASKLWAALQFLHKFEIHRTCTIHPCDLGAKKMATATITLGSPPHLCSTIVTCSISAGLGSEGHKLSLPRLDAC